MKLVFAVVLNLRYFVLIFRTFYRQTRQNKELKHKRKQVEKMLLASGDEKRQVTCMKQEIDELNEKLKAAILQANTPPPQLDVLKKEIEHLKVNDGG